MAVPITSGGASARQSGLCVVVAGHETNGVAVCNQIRSFDLEQRVRVGSAKFIESLDRVTCNEIASRVVSISIYRIEPEANCALAHALNG